MTFQELELIPQLMKAVDECGYKIPTPIQEKAIPKVLAGGDVMGLAQTGTGKTAAFTLPLLQRLATGPKGRVRVLVLAPTRELAEQTQQSFCTLGKYLNFKSTSIYGGVGIVPQMQKLKRGVEVVVACPGRLLDHIGRGTIDLRGVEALVLDEADRMFDMGFLPDIKKILTRLPEKRQSLLFSATMPADIRKLAQEILHDPSVVQVDHEAPADTISHALYPVEQHFKTTLLKELLSRTETDSVLVFTRTKHRAEKLALTLKTAGYTATSLQGNLSQNKRQAALDGFRRGSYKILVATDIAARGIDVSKISHVINYDMPDSPDAYTHRIGRTGRAYKTGEAYTLVTSEDAAMVATIDRLLGQKTQRCTLEGLDYIIPDISRASHAPAPRYGAPRGYAGNGRSGDRQDRSSRPPQGRRPSSEPRTFGGYKGGARRSDSLHRDQ